MLRLAHCMQRQQVVSSKQQIHDGGWGVRYWHTPLKDPSNWPEDIIKPNRIRNSHFATRSIERHSPVDEYT